MAISVHSRGALSPQEGGKHGRDIEQYIKHQPHEVTLDETFTTHRLQTLESNSCET
jgi:hypothetical protein